MAKRQYRTLDKRMVDGLSVDGKDAVFRDRDLPGFGVRVCPSGAKVDLVQTRVGGKTKRVTIGRHGLVSAEDARLEAVELISRIRRGKESTGSESVTTTVNGTTLAEVANRYMREHVSVRCKPTTARAYRVALENY